jgi:hypothetical protein
MQRHLSISTARCQRGLGTVAVSLILLFALSVLVFYFNRHVLFEHRTAVNQSRAIQSHALAQGGLDWALARLNDPRELQTVCAFGAGGRARDLVLATASDTLHAACRIGDAGHVACACALNAVPAAWPHASAPLHGFAVQLKRHADDAQAVQVEAMGCVNSTTPCNADAPSDAQSRLHVIARGQPLLWRRPVATITAGGSIRACSPAALNNADSTTRGWWAHAGESVLTTCAAPALVVGVPGSIAASHGGDGLLAARATASDTFFASWFGTTLADYRAVACEVGGDTPGARGAELWRLHEQGCRRFIVDGDLLLDADTALGTADDPVALVLLNRATIADAATVVGLIYTDAVDADAVRWGGLRWQGAVVARGAVHIDTAVDGRFDDGVLRRLSERAAVMVAVPGSWRDE